MGSDLLTPENFESGFLVDDALMAGVTRDPQHPDRYVGFVLAPETGEYLGYESYASLDDALARINAIPRTWAFETTSGCDGKSCAGGKCGQAGTAHCPKQQAKLQKHAAGSAPQAPSAFDCGC